jgi:hypothetical protein
VYRHPGRCHTVAMCLDVNAWLHVSFVSLHMFMIAVLFCTVLWNKLSITCTSNALPYGDRNLL